MKTPIRLVIADDHDIYRKGLMAVLHIPGLIEIAGEAANGIALLETVERTQPDIVLTDIMMPEMDGIEACKRIRAENVLTRVIGMTVFEDNGLIIEMIEAGAEGFVLKNSGKEAMTEAIEKVFNGETHYCVRTNKRLTEFWGKRNAKLKQPYFTARELQVIEMICDGLSHDEIAQKLFISKKTVDSCSHRVLQKIDRKNAVGLVKYAIMNGLYRMRNER